MLKLDGVGPIDFRHFNNYLNFFTAYKFHMCYWWHMKRGMWHVTYDMWQMVGG